MSAAKTWAGDGAPALAPGGADLAATAPGGAGAPSPAQIFAADMAAVRAVSLQATGFTAPVPETASADLASASSAAPGSSGAGLAGALACLLGGGGLLTICVTLWWHGRRFARVV